MAMFGLEAEEYDRKYKDRELTKRITSKFRPYLRGVVVVILFIAAYSIAGAFVPILASGLITNLEGSVNANYLLIIILVIFLLNCLGWVFNYFQQKYSAIVVGGVMLDLRREATAAALNRDLAFFDRNPIGKIVSRINTDSQDFGDAIYLLIQFVASILMVVVVAWYMFTINIFLTIIFLSIIPIFFVTAILFRKVARGATLLGQRALAQVNEFIQESFSGIQIAKTFRQENKLYTEFNKINTQCYKVNLKRGLILNFIYPSLNIVQGVILAVLIFFGGSSVLGGQINAGELYLFLQALWLLFFPLFSIAAFWPQFQAGMSAAERIFSIIDTPSNVIQKETIEPKLNGEIEFKSLTFFYEKDQKVYDQFSLTIHPGESIAIVGHTGAGKSTLAKLLMRFYEFQEGDILFEGISIKNFNLEAYRKMIGFITQTPFLWADTIENNVKFGNPTATKEEVIWALSQAGGADWVNDL
ncbi:MAG TPA: ABC transporter ATP-binding protein, partial [Candidatus Deferrimicrobium sp.]|nr:ABC transporter ATP-binding protein [Candidatus Deferrimicrobium sp.]